MAYIDSDISNEVCIRAGIIKGIAHNEQEVEDIGKRLLEGKVGQDRRDSFGLRCEFYMGEDGLLRIYLFH